MEVGVELLLCSQLLKVFGELSVEKVLGLVLGTAALHSSSVG